MKTLYIISKGYYPSTAGCNRELALTKGFGELGTKVKVFYLLPNEANNKVDTYFDNVEFTYLWEDSISKNKLYLLVRSIYLMLSMIKRGSKVLIFWAKLLVLPLCWKGAELFHEKTEHPEEGGKSTKSILFNRVSKGYLRRLRKIKGLFVITHNLKNYFISEGVDATRISVINMVVDSHRFDNIVANNNKEKYIAYCGTVSVGKDGVDFLIKSFNKVAAVIDDVKLYIIGNFHSDRDRNMLLDCVEQYGLTERIVFTGRVDFTQMPQLLSNAQALVLARPSNKQATYGFPTKLGEYLLTGNPVVITRTGEIDLFLEDMKSAIIAEANEIDSIAEKMIWTLQNIERAREIGLAGKKVALNSFNYKLEAKKMLDVIF